MNRAFIGLLAGAVLAVGSTVSHASVIISSTTYAGPNVNFTGISSSSNPDTGSLIDLLSGSADGLSGTSLSFNLNQGSGSSASQTSTLSTDMSANSSGFGIQSIDLSTAGDYNLGVTSPGTGQHPTAGYNFSATVTIFSVNNHVLGTPLVWNATVGSDSFATPSGGSNVLWSKSGTLDIASFLQSKGYSAGSQATNLSLVINTQLSAASTSADDTAFIEDKSLALGVATAPVSETPVPASGLLILAGVGLLFTGRGLRRSSTN